MNRRIFIIVIILILCYSCVKKEPTLISIASAKQISHGANALTGENDDTEHYIDGYYYADPIPILVTNLKWIHINSPMPDSVYIVLNYSREKAKEQNLLGKYVRFRGKVKSARIGFAPERNNFQVTGSAIILNNRPNQLKPGLRRFNKVRQNKGRPFGPSVVSPNYALLYSGGDDEINNWTRYWNDLCFMYCTLQRSGYAANHIIVVYGDGRGKDGDKTIPVNFAATEKGLDNAISILAEKLNAKTQLFLFLTNHGGGYNFAEKKNEFGVLSRNPERKNKIDATIFYYRQPVNTIDCYNFASKLNKLPFSKLIVFAGQCYSGGFIHDLRGKNRVVITACSEFEVSYGDNKDSYDEFADFFISAINGADDDDHVVSGADIDKNGHISVLEAFLYAKHHDTQHETPLLEDTGLADGTNVPGAGSGKPGSYANASYIY